VPSFHAELAGFAGLDAQVVGISNDPIPCHIAWQTKDIGRVDFPLCSDFYPHGDVARKYGILREGPPIAGINERCVFIVDKSGRIAFSRVYPLDQTPEIPEILEVLRKMQESAA
jgi:alkyl hydroperoxide reductase subunit AhpC